MFTYTCKDINGCNQYLKQIILHVFLRKMSHHLKGKVFSHTLKRENLSEGQETTLKPIVLRFKDFSQNMFVKSTK